nr:TPM domain-containing protein [uncultured Psychroserpens sp.]
MRQFLFIFTLLSCVSCKTDTATAVDYSLLPKNKEQHVVVDLSNLFTLSETQTLSKKIIDYESNSTNEIAILTVNSIEPFTDIALYSSAIGNYWGVGKKEKDNGLVIVISKEQRLIWFSPGDGTTKILTDSICQNIIDQSILPDFKNGNFYQGINQGLDAVLQKWH